MKGAIDARGCPMGRIVALLAAACLAAALSACHSTPAYQQPDRHRKPVPQEAAVANMKMALEYLPLFRVCRADHGSPRQGAKTPRTGDVR